MKAFISGVLVRIALPWHGKGAFLRQWFVFFAVSLFFAGALLAIWMLFSPAWLTWYNGVAYFHISPLVLLVSTIAAYLLLTLAGRISGAGRLKGSICSMTVFLNGKACTVRGLLDTGNSLTEPFSGTPVAVCQVEDLATLFPEGLAQSLRQGLPGTGSDIGNGMEFRLIPYRGVDSGGVLPAFRPDRVSIRDDEGAWHVDDVYVALSRRPIGNESYSAILNPDMIRMKTVNGGAKK